MARDEHFGCLVAVGDDRVGLVRDATGFLVEVGVNIRSIRSTTLGHEFGLLAQFCGTNDQVKAVEAGLAAMQKKTGLSVLFHRSEMRDQPAQTHELTHDLFISAYDAVGIVSTVSALLARHDVSIERLGGDRYHAPNQGQPLFTIVASVHVPKETDAETLQSELEALRERQGWADAELHPHGRFNAASLTTAQPFPPRDQWSSHSTPPSPRK